MTGRLLCAKEGQDTAINSVFPEDNLLSIEDREN